MIHLSFEIQTKRKVALNDIFDMFGNTRVGDGYKGGFSREEDTEGGTY